MEPEVFWEERRDDYGVLVMEPLEEGFGITIGNALRRVLLGALEGAAITSVKIEGIPHQFSPIPHAKEDVIEFILNLKGVRFRIKGERPAKMKLEVKGEREVLAGDIKTTPDYEIVNPEHYLLTLDSPEAHLDAELEVRIGKRHISDTDEENLPIGVIPVDAVFSPIKAVNYKVEKKAGKEGGYESLRMEIWTDKTITPEEAVAKASEILVRHFSILLGKPIPEVRKAPPEPIDLSIDDLGLSERTKNALKRANIMWVREIVDRTESELRDIRGLGEKSIEELKEKLKSLGLSLREEPEITELEEKLGAKFKVRKKK